MLLEQELAENQIDHSSAHCMFHVGDIAVERRSLKSRNTCGPDPLVVEMIRETEAADGNWTATFNARRAICKIRLGAFSMFASYPRRTHPSSSNSHVRL